MRWWKITELGEALRQPRAESPYEDPPRPPERSWGGVVALSVLLVILLAAFWMLPAFQGYHIGCNVLYDHERLVRLGLEWCR